MASKRKVFKVRTRPRQTNCTAIESLLTPNLAPARQVETVGDCYVAVTGLPDPLKDHAVVMSRFANDCLNKMVKVVEVLEVTLGPDTADLS